MFHTCTRGDAHSGAGFLLGVVTAPAVRQRRVCASMWMVVDVRQG